MPPPWASTPGSRTLQPHVRPLLPLANNPHPPPSRPSTPNKSQQTWSRIQSTPNVLLLVLSSDFLFLLVNNNLKQKTTETWNIGHFLSETLAIVNCLHEWKLMVKGTLFQFTFSSSPISWAFANITWRTLWVLDSFTPYEPGQTGLVKIKQDYCWISAALDL